MKRKPEKLDNLMFDAFQPQDAWGVVGAMSQYSTAIATTTPAGMDMQLDMAVDITEEDLHPHGQTIL